MSYNKEDLKKMGLRIAKNINHDLQRSKMNSYLKPYFTESSVQFVDNGKFLGIALNVNPIDIEDTLDEMEQVRFINNMKLLQETVNRYLKKEKADVYFELKTYSEDTRLIEFGNTYVDNYKNFALGIKSEAFDDTMDDSNKVSFIVPGFSSNTYEISPENQGNATTKDLKDEINNDDPLRVLADPNQGKLKVPNGSHYNDMIIDTGIQRDIEG